MKLPFRPLAAGTLLASALAAGPALAAKDVTFAVASTFTTTDPYDANDTLSQAMAKSSYEGLFGFDKDMKLVPVLAESYDVSKDGLVYTIKLKKGIKFHDGTDFKADAVKTSLDRVTNPDNKLKRYSLYKIIGQIAVINDYTVRFTLCEPFGAMIATFAHPAHRGPVRPGHAGGNPCARGLTGLRHAGQVSGANRLVLDATLAEGGEMRYTPAGIPALECVLRHASVQSEAGGERRVECELAAIAFGDPAIALSRVEAGAACGAGASWPGDTAPASPSRCT